MTAYLFDQQHRFVVEGYNKAKPFSGFLPGIAGGHGIPMWVFYVNRGQGIASFGVQDKNCSIMEFYPANKSYQLTPTVGFRTFIKWEREGRNGYWEPFGGSLPDGVMERMIQAPNGLEIVTEHEKAGLAVHVDYFTLPGEAFTALVRHAAFRNTGDSPVRLELLDGLPLILPYGIDNTAYKELGHTLKSWMDVYNMEHRIPFYKVRASTADTAEVSQVTAGHFYLSFLSDGTNSELALPVVDSENVFGTNTSLREPDGFLAESVASILSKSPVTANKVPCGFTGAQKELGAGETLHVYTLVGHTSLIDTINRKAEELANPAYIEAKKREAAALVETLTDTIRSNTALPLFDAYARQCFLDNVLRGGYPLLLGGGEGGSRKIFHVYSRKHGDLERDYNFFSLEPSYYSQGNGNFRDVNQNRRSDIFFEPEMGNFNVKLFMNLIQPDGYNPLVVKGSTFRLEEGSAPLEGIAEFHRDKVRAYLEKPYTPGGFLQWLADEGIGLSVPAAELLAEVLSRSVQETEALFGEGYWTDHWTYNLDHIEAYSAVYPDRLRELLFDDKSYMYYDSPAVVLPRSEKYVLAGNKVRQYNSVFEDEAKREAIAGRGRGGSWVRLGHGTGDIYRTHLYEKLIFLALIKFTTLDPFGLGVEMEAGKPGWNDSLNGLPGLFGSGFSETCELRRLVSFLLGVPAAVLDENHVQLPAEIAGLLQQAEQELDLYNASACNNRDFVYWDCVSNAREHYRESVRYGFSGEFVRIGFDSICRLLRKFEAKLEQGFERALALGKGIYPTYFYYEAEEVELLRDKSGAEKRNGKGQKLVRAGRFRVHVLPPFLEGAARAMKVLRVAEEKRELYARVRESGIYDRKLGMYKVNAPLGDESFELGRTRAFTPGWLENESVFLHMEYKYLLELLKSELYESFFEDMRQTLIPFLKPEVYGRSTLENSSFIASSANPDPSLHGAGFVARLSGSTAEFLQMWLMMMAGRTPFILHEGSLALKLSPVLPGWMFDKDGKVRFRFLNSCDVTYVNDCRADTFGNGGVSPVHYVLTYADDSIAEVEGDVLGQPYASDVRNKQVKAIKVALKSE